MAGKSVKKSERTLGTTLPYIFVICSLIALLASAVLMIDKLSLLENPNQQLNCDINPIVACGSVILTDQASAFGVPNPIFGLMGFAATTTIGVAMLAGAKFKKWFWQGVQVGLLFGVGFVAWLQYQTIFNIGALCPYCMVVWAMMIPMFWYALLYSLREKHIPTPEKLKGLAAFAQKEHGNILLVWFLVIVSVILKQFWYYWSTLI